MGSFTTKRMMSCEGVVRCHWELVGKAARDESEMRRLESTASTSQDERRVGCVCAQMRSIETARHQVRTACEFDLLVYARTSIPVLHAHVLQARHEVKRPDDDDGI